MQILEYGTLAKISFWKSYLMDVDTNTIKLAKSMCVNTDLSRRNVAQLRYYETKINYTELFGCLVLT